MNAAKALCIAALAVPPLILGIASSSADTLDRSLRDLTLGGPCYDFDPYDPYHLYGKYYPYDADHCRHRSLKRERVVQTGCFARRHCALRHDEREELQEPVLNSPGHF